MDQFYTCTQCYGQLLVKMRDGDILLSLPHMWKAHIEANKFQMFNDIQ
jgi:hypothetical protein